ncbi:hypothetical protein QYE76_007156 [Lolium multiflorum]|uniref:Uncharacterized protein n=1 Tax=Lolium multiflorum TaxID=4521 RepID=A0AAD8RWC4_LOLMU|nr:hypothetical protein QYE76_007156 [Lolium multiflorum]
MVSPTRPPDYAARAAWALCLPTKLKIFSYLACIDSSRANLFFMGCAPSDVCAACAAFETCRHILFDYTLAASVWVRLGVAVPAGPFSFWELQRPFYGLHPSDGRRGAHGLAVAVQAGGSPRA